MPQTLQRGLLLLALATAPALVLVSCSSAGTGGSTWGESEGVTSKTVAVGGMAASTGPSGNQFRPIFGAVQAYFDMVNAHGGIDGRKLVYPYKRDDQARPDVDLQQAKDLVQQDHVFAVVGIATPYFAGGAYLGQNHIPTFGLNINPEFANYPSSFGDNGSYLSPNQQSPVQAWLAQHVHATRVGVIGYDDPQSMACGKGAVTTFNKFHLDTVLQEASLPFGTSDMSAVIQRLHDSRAQEVASCMDAAGSASLSRGLEAAGLYNQVAQYWSTGYDMNTLAHFENQMQGVYVSDRNVPYLHGYTKGMDQYLDAMAVEHLNVGDVTAAGWIAASLFVTGLKMSGRNLTRSNLIRNLNTLTDYTADGMTVGIDWTQQHTSPAATDCSTVLQVRGDAFVPINGPLPRNPYLCFGGSRATTYPVAFPEPGNFFSG